jgi:stage II sporulation protein AA (anti-sigma F factor antagonist)
LVLLDVEIEQFGKAMIVRLKGELDHHTAETLKAKMEQALEENDCHHIVLSMKDLTFMDSSGLGVILGRYKKIKGRGGQMIVCDVNTGIYKLFEMSGMFKIVAVEQNENDALGRLGVVS